MREFDATCLAPVRPMPAADIRALRMREGASQAVFARYLNGAGGAGRARGGGLMGCGDPAEVLISNVGWASAHQRGVKRHDMAMTPG